MTLQFARSVEVTCPCCQARLTVDLHFPVGFGYERPRVLVQHLDISDAAGIMAKEVQRREVR